MSWSYYLYHSISSCNKENFDKIMSEISVSTVDFYGNTPLHVIAALTSTEEISFLLKNGADINAKNSNGNTPLHISCELYQTKNTRFLVEAGADIDSKNYNGNTPLHFAAYNNCYEPAEILLDNGAICFFNNEMKTPMDISFEKKYPGTFKLFEYRKFVMGLINQKKYEKSPWFFGPPGIFYNENN